MKKLVKLAAALATLMMTLSFASCGSDDDDDDDEADDDAVLHVATAATDIVVTQTGKNLISVTWTNGKQKNGSDSSDYLYYSETNDISQAKALNYTNVHKGKPIVVGSDGTATSKTYYFFVKSTNGYVETASVYEEKVSAAKPFVVTLSTLPAPTNPTCTVTQNGESYTYSFTWDKVEGWEFVRYQIKGGSKSSFLNLLGTSEVDASSMTVSSTTGTSAYFSITAFQLADSAQIGDDYTTSEAATFMKTYTSN